MKKQYFIWILLAILLNACSYKRKLTAKKVTLSPLYSNGMVIQTEPETRIHGYSEPGSTLAVKIADYIRLVESDSTGRWSVHFPTIILSKPFSIFIEGVDTIIELKDVLAGKVIVVAGDAFLDPLSALNEDIYSDRDEKLFRKIKVFKPVPLTIQNPATQYLNSAWIPATEMINHASTCKILNAISKFLPEKNAAIGIIDLTWPGSTVEAWLPDNVVNDTLPSGQVITYLPKLHNINDSILNEIKYKADTCRNGINRGVKRVWFDDEFWRETTLPVNLAERFEYEKKRIVYLRKKIYISSKYLTSDFRINLGKVHGHAEFYFNGIPVEANLSETGQTQLFIPDTIMQTWSNVLVTRLFCIDSLSGFYGTDFSITNLDSTYVRNIDESWKYNFLLEDDFPQLAGIENTPSSLYNGMLSPLNLNNTFTFIWYGGFNNRDPSQTGDMICSLLEEIESENKYILTDSPELYDTLIYGKRIEMLVEELNKAELYCAVNEVIINESP